MKVNIKTLGCKVNAYESEYIRREFEKNGYEIVSDNAEVYVINTCTVTNNSDIKSKKLIRRIRRENPNSVLIVCGCFTEFKKEDINEIIDADIIIGNKDKSKIVNYLEEFLNDKKQIIKFYDTFNDFEDMELDKFETKTRAFVKIEDGCENFCSYCIIPYVRGPVRSKEPKKVIEEIKDLVNSGHKEVVLTGIHTGHYGSDLDNYTFYDLLKEILKIKDLKRLRISSIEITELTTDILNLLKNTNVLAHHFHIPLQSGCDKTLKEMNRKYDTKYFMDKVKEIRNIIPDISLTTDVIVGFPNETDEDFCNTYNYIKTIGFSKIHVFPYSERSGTKSASMKNKVDGKLKKDRANKLLSLSQELENNYYDNFLNKELEVLIEEYKDGFFIGHTSNYLKILIKSEEGIMLNSSYIIKIEKVINSCAYAKIIK